MPRLLRTSQDSQSKAGKRLRAVSYHLIHKELHLVTSTEGFNSSDLMDHITTTEMNRLYREEYVLSRETER